MSETAEPEKSAHGLVRVRDPDGTIPSAHSTHHSQSGTGATRVMNEASHGVDVDADAAKRAVVVGMVFLAELKAMAFNE